MKDRSRYAAVTPHSRTVAAMRGAGGALLLSLAATAATAVPICSISATATLSFGAVVALASSGDQSANTGTSLWVNCTADVATTPSLYWSTPRTLVSAVNSLPFGLSASSPGVTELRASSPGTALTILKNGTNEAVTLHGRVRAVDFRALPSGSYSRIISLTLKY